MDINYIAILVATVVQFIIGAIWYMPLFGGLWGRIHGFESHSPEEKEEMRRKKRRKRRGRRRRRKR